MAFYDKFPYTNFQEINLDKIIQKVGDIDRAETHVEELTETATNAVEQASASAQAAEDSAASADTSANNAAGSLNTIRSTLQGAVDTWLDDHFTVTSGVILDETLTSKNAAAQAFINGMLFDILGTHFQLRESTSYQPPYGFVNNTLRTCIVGHSDNNINIKSTSGFNVSTYELNADNTCINPEGAQWAEATMIPPGYFAMNIKKTDNTAFSDADILNFFQNSTFTVYPAELQSFEKTGYPVVPVSNYMYHVTFNYFMTAPANRKSLGHRGMTSGHCVALKAAAGKDVSFNLFRDPEMTDVIASSGWRKAGIIPNDLYSYGIVRNSDNSNITSETDLFTLDEEAYQMENGNRKDVHVKNAFIGDTGIQSMEYASGYLYTLKNGVIEKRSLDGTIIESHNVNTGHGNGLCRGEHGYLYISGWDDGKIYKLDLSTWTTTVISLNVSGWFTAFYMPFGNQLYIMHTDTYPDTAVQWKIYTVNEATGACTFLTNVANTFAGLQDITVKSNYIIVASGFGTEANPSRITMYSVSNGQERGYYKLFTDQCGEYEGVTVTDTDLYYSDSNALVLKTSV